MSSGADGSPGGVGETGSAPGWRWLVAAALLAAVAGLTLALAPLVPEAGESGQPRPHATATPSPAPDGGAPAGESRRWRSLVQREGSGIAVVLAVPLLICLVPLLAPARLRRPLAIGAVALLGMCVVAGALSAGLFVLPSAVAMAVAAVRLRPPAPAGTAS
jgi:hypothetical protein